MREEGDTWQGTVQLTSQIEMGENRLTTESQREPSDQNAPVTNVLQSPLSTPMTNPSHLSSSSSGGPERLGDPPRLHEDRRSSQPSRTRLEPPLEYPRPMRASSHRPRATPRG